MWASYRASSWLPDSILTPHHSPVASLLQDSDKDGHVSFDEFIHYVGKLGEGIGMPPEVWDWMGLVAGKCFKYLQMVTACTTNDAKFTCSRFLRVWHPLRLKHHERMFLGMGGLKPLRRPAMRQVAAANCSKCGGSRFRLPAVLNRIHWGVFLIWGIPKMDGLQWNILFKL